MSRCGCLFATSGAKTYECSLCFSYRKRAVARDAIGIARFELDILDDQIVELLLARFRRLDRIAEIKVEHDLPAYDPERERAIEERIVRATESVRPEVRLAIEELMRELIRRSRLQVDLRMRITREEHVRRHDQDNENRVDEKA